MAASTLSICHDLHALQTALSVFNLKYSLEIFPHQRTFPHDFYFLSFWWKFKLFTNFIRRNNDCGNKHSYSLVHAAMPITSYWENPRTGIIRLKSMRFNTFNRKKKAFKKSFNLYSYLPCIKIPIFLSCKNQAFHPVGENPCSNVTFLITSWVSHLYILLAFCTFLYELTIHSSTYFSTRFLCFK